MQSKCTECGFKKSRFVKEQEAKGLFSNLGIKTPLSKIPLLIVLRCIKMNKIVKKFLLTGDIFMQEMHLKQPGFAYSACGPFTKNKERIEKFMQTGNTDFIYRNELDKACFQHDMAYGKSKGLAKRTQSNKVLRDQVFKTATEPKYDGYQRRLASMVYNFLIKSLVQVVLPLNQIINLQMNFIGRLSKKLREEKFIHLLETIFGVQI